MVGGKVHVVFPIFVVRKVRLRKFRVTSKKSNVVTEDTEANVTYKNRLKRFSLLAVPIDRSFGFFV